MKIRKITSIFLICALAIFTAACAKGNVENNKEALNNDKTVVESNIDQDKELTDELLKEDEVSRGQVYIQDEWVIGAIIIKDDVSEERAKELAQKYAEELKEKYKDKKINVQAVNSNKNLANIVL